MITRVLERGRGRQRRRPGGCDVRRTPPAIAGFVDGVGGGCADRGMRAGAPGGEGKDRILPGTTLILAP